MLKARLLPVLLSVTLLGALAGCLTPPDYPDEPSIEFKSLTRTRNTPPRPFVVTDTFAITVSFRDGNGDLGLTADDILQPPYQELNADGSPNPNHFNYYLRSFRRIGGMGPFVEIFPGEEFSQFFPLNQGEDAKPAPLRGELTFRKFYDLESPFQPGDEIRFMLSIRDRALNESNTITTSTDVIPPR